MQKFADQKKSSLTAKKRALLLQRRAVLTISVCKQQTSEGVDLRTTTLAYPLQKKHHPPLQGNLEVLLLYLITKERKSFLIVSCLV